MQGRVRTSCANQTLGGQSNCPPYQFCRIIYERHDPTKWQFLQKKCQNPLTLSLYFSLRVGQNAVVKTLFQFTLGLFLVIATVLSASAAFSSLYVFGDALSATNDNNPDSGSPGQPSYYGYRWSNGRVWVEVLAQRQGVSFPYNNSYWDHNSTLTAVDVTSFIAPPDVANDLFVVWVCNADTFDASSDVGNSSSTSYNALLNLFISDNIRAQANNLLIITQLYAKGVRTLIMPNAVDISEIPAYNAGNATAVLHAGCVDYNARLASTINQARAVCPGLQIYTPDFYTLLNNVLANPGYYGLSNVLYGGYSIDAIDNYSPNVPPLNGSANNYIFWDQQDPTAKFHEIIADVAQQIVSPVQFSGIKQINGSNRLDVVNVPLGLNGFVLGSTNLVSGSWAMVTNFNSLTSPQSIFVITPPLPANFFAPTNSGGSGDINPNDPPPTNTVPGTNAVFISAAQFYQLQFPYAWSWP
jgi:phospholipase/lecithinase/hemolysin